MDFKLNPKEDATPSRETTFKDGEKVKTKTDSKTNYYKNGNLSAVTKGKYTYVYEYGSDGKRTKSTKYKSSDCKNGVPNKGAKAISTENYSKKSTKTSKK